MDSTTKVMEVLEVLEVREVLGEVVSEARRVALRAPCFASQGPIRRARSAETSAYTKHAHTIVSPFVVVVVLLPKNKRGHTIRVLLLSAVNKRGHMRHALLAVNTPFLAVKQERTHASRIVGSKRPFFWQ
jgi:hypothetical protein